ncbi:Nuclear cap-binding protein subunit 1 [Thelohanellus kitauei]|uniref:Nuclear cap-binding protein subunit 1 n=1 Tax=Thelohanellus kitauei TaxID=669202 RepID=A0A0C2N1X6_THEKT|nr:Nuclear cap-binding protein subunit 1 [Thelohanellus kitauei]
MSFEGNSGVKRKFNNQGGYRDFKKFSHDEDPVQTIEDLISEISLQRDAVTIEDIDILVANIKREISTRKNTIICTFVQCFSNRRFKVPLYSTIVGQLNQYDEYFGSDLVESLAMALQDSFLEKDLTCAFNIILSLCDLCNVEVVQRPSVLTLLETLLVAANDENASPIQTQWFLLTILHTLPYIGETMENHRACRDAFNNLIKDIDESFKHRKKGYAKALRIWIKDEEFLQFEEIDYTYQIVMNLRDKKWKIDSMDRPYESIRSELGSKSHKFTIENIPNIPVKHFPIPKIVVRVFDEAESRDSEICGSFLPAFGDYERYHICGMISDLINTGDDHKKNLFLIKSSVRNKIYNMPYLIVEALMNEILNYSDFDGSHTKYYSAISELCRQFKDTFVRVIDEMVCNFFEHLASMNVVYFHKFLDWFTIYSNNYSATFDWSVLRASITVSGDEGQLLFFRTVISRLYSLTDVTKNQVVQKLYDSLKLPPTDCIFDYAGKPEKVVITTFATCIREKKSNDQIIESLEQLAGENPSLSLLTAIIHFVFKTGSKTLTHTGLMFEKYLAIINHFIKKSDDSAEKIIESVYSFWQNNPIRLKHALSLFYQNDLLKEIDVISWFMNLQKSNAESLFPWEVILEYFSLINCCKKKSAKRKKGDANKGEKAASISIDVGDNDAKKRSKEQRKEILFKMTSHMAEFIHRHVSECGETPTDTSWFTYILQRFQQLLFQNHDFFVKNQEFLLSLVTKSGQEEHVIEILNRFQSIYS